MTRTVHSRLVYIYSQGIGGYNLYTTAWIRFLRSLWAIGGYNCMDMKGIKFLKGACNSNARASISRV